VPAAWMASAWDDSGMGAPSATVTFLFTDIVGSTRLWQADETAMRAAVARHDELLRSAIAAHDGVVFARLGDGVAAAFSSATSAIDAAQHAQRLVQTEPWPTPTPVRVRMGVHTGEAEHRDGDYFGVTVNRAARLMAIGNGGQVLCSETTAGLVDRAGLVGLGEHRLRDLDLPMRVFQLGGGSFPPLRSDVGSRTNIPSVLTGLMAGTPSWKSCAT
jgi:class 3 adenylate cyclase